MAAAALDGLLVRRRQLASRHWVALAVYPLLSFFSPSESYLFQYLTTVKDFSARQLVVLVFPWWSYALPACLLLVVALGRIGHKRTVVLGAVARLSAAAIVVAAPAGNVRLMQLDQVCFALFFAAKTAALPALLFEVFEPREYQRALALVRGCVLLGSASSAFCGQLLVARGAPLETLVRATFWCHLGGLAASLALPSPSGPSRAHGIERAAQDSPCAFPPQPALASARASLASLRRALGAPRLRALLLWHVGIVAVQQLALTYYQALFSALAGGAGVQTNASGALWLPPHGHALPATTWNGGVVGVADLAGALASFAAGDVRVERVVRRRLRVVAAGTSAVAALLLGVLGGAALAPAWAPPLPAAYACFVGAQITFEFARTVGVAQLAVGLEARGCRLFLSALVGCQLCVCVAQVFLQVSIQAVATEPLRQFYALALASAATALCLTLGACRDRAGAPASAGGWKPPLDWRLLVAWAPAAGGVHGAVHDGSAPSSSVADGGNPTGDPIATLVVDERDSAATLAAPLLPSDDYGVTSVCVRTDSSSSHSLPSGQSQARNNSRPICPQVLAQPSPF
jgi:hypothetical protein